MPTRKNPAFGGGFNSPGFAEAAQGLGALFTPPSGADAAGFANAALTRDKAERARQFYEYSLRPDANRAELDKRGIGSGAFNPNQSFYSVDLNNQTELDKAGINAKADVFKTMYGNAGPNTSRPAVPDAVAGQYGLPGMPAYNGPIVANRGDNVYVDGKVYSGQAVPMTEEQVLGAILASLPPEERRKYLGVGKGVEQVVGQNGQVTYASRADAVGQQAHIKPEHLTEIGRLIRERDALPPGDPRRASYDERIRVLGKPVNENAYDTAAGKSFADLGNEIFTNAQKAVGDSALYQTVLSAVDNPTVDQGTFGQAALGMKKALNFFGITNAPTAPAEMLNALGNQIALRLRDPSTGGGMPGALSDADRVFLQQMSMSLGNSPQANRLLAEYFLAAQTRNLGREALRQRYVAQNGRLDEGFRAALMAHDQDPNNDPTQAVRAKIAAMVPPSPAPPPPARNADGSVTINTPGGPVTVRPRQ